MLRRWIAGGLICCFLTGNSLYCAEEPPVSAAEVRALIHRLEQAEAKIGRLEAELEATQASQPQPFPGQTTALFDDAAKAPAAESVGDVSELLKRNEELVADLQKLTESHEKLSESHKELSEDYDKFSSDTLKGKGVVIPSGTAASIRLSGRIHLDYWAFPHANAGAAVLEGSPAAPVDPEDRFGIRRLRVTTRGDITDNVLYRFDLEFANPGDYEFRDAYLGIKDLPILQELQIGNQKRPYSLDAICSSNHTVFLERPAVADAFNPDFRRLGIQSWGVSEDERWNWRYGVFNGVNVQNGDGFTVSNHYQLETAGRLAQTWWYDELADGRGYAHRAVSFSVAHPDGDSPDNTARFASRPEARTTTRWLDTGRIAGAEWYEMFNTEHVLNVGPVQLLGETQNLFLQREGGSDLHFWGAYGQASYFLTGEHMPWDRKTGQLARVKPFENFFLVNRLSGGTGGGWGAWQVAGRYSFLDISDKDVLGGEGNQTSLALVWYWNSNSRVQFDWEHGWIDDDHAKLVAAGESGAEYDALGVRFSVDF